MSLKFIRDCAELFEGGFEIIDDFLGKNVGIGKIVGIFEAFVSEPEDIEADFVVVNQLVVTVGVPVIIGIFPTMCFCNDGTTKKIHVPFFSLSQRFKH